MIFSAAASAPPVIPNYGGPPGGRHGCIAQNGTFCWDWVKGHWGDILQPRLLEHLEMTAIAVGIGFAIAFAAALLAHRKRWFETPFGVFSAFLYTIPSLALFQLLVPFTGLTMLTIEIGLVGYTLLILFRNILAGLPPTSRRSAWVSRFSTDCKPTSQRSSSPPVRSQLRLPSALTPRSSRCSGR